MHKTKQNRDRNRTTTSLVLDSSMLRGRKKCRLKPANLVAFKLSVFESPRISFLRYLLLTLMTRDRIGKPNFANWFAKWETEQI